MLCISRLAGWTFVGILAVGAACAIASAKDPGATGTQDATPAFRRLRILNRATDGGSIKNVKLRFYQDHNADVGTFDAMLKAPEVPGLAEVKKDSALILDGPADFTLTAAAYKRVIMTWELWSDAATPVKLFDYTATLIAPAMTAAQVAGGPQVSVWSENWIEEFYVRVNASDVTQVSVRGEHLSGPSYLGVPVFAWPGTVTRAPQ